MISSYSGTPYFAVYIEIPNSNKFHVANLVLSHQYPSFLLTNDYDILFVYQNYSIYLNNSYTWNIN